MDESSTLTVLKQRVSADDVVLDIGTKDGSTVSGLPGTVLGLDVSAARFDDGSDVSFLLGDGHLLPVQTASVDYVIATQLLEHVPETDQVIQEIARVLTPDGEVYVSFPNRYSLDKPHNPIPRYYSLLPRPVGRRLAPLLLDEESVKYYEQATFPLSPLSARVALHRHFEDVTFPMRLDPSAVSSVSVVQSAVWWLNTVAMRPPLQWLGEMLWPYSSYICRHPVTAPDD